MHCSVVFGVTLRLLAINISSSSPAINTAAYYQRCVITCETVAVVHRRSRLQHLAYCIVNTGSHAHAESRFLPTPPAFDAPIRGFPSEYCYAVWHGKTRMSWLPMVKKIWWYVYSFWHNSRTWQMDRQTPHDDIGRAYMASRGNKIDTFCLQIEMAVMKPEIVISRCLQQPRLKI